MSPAGLRAAAELGSRERIARGYRNQEVTTVALNLAQKETIVAEVAEVAKGAYSAIGAEYRGLTVA
jgi:ribosomal protein L10